jgi:hypothetical protein
MSLWSWAIPAAVGIGSALIGSNATKKAANTAAQAAQQAQAVTREDLAPWRDTGSWALGQLRGELGSGFQLSPGYDFAMSEGVRAIDRGASARGLLGSGARLRELTRYGQGLANQEYGSYLNRLAALAGLGQTAATNTAQMGGQALMQGGLAQAQGGINSANAILGGANAGLGLYALMNPNWGR